jgi:hypothetical protein
MNRVINGGNVARMYQERGDGFYSTGLASGTPRHLHSLKFVSKLRIDPFIYINAGILHLPHIFRFLLLCQLFVPSSAFSQESSNVAFQVKSFLEHPPALENLVFSHPCKEMGDIVEPNEENLFTASVQDDSFTLAVLKTPSEVPQMAAKALPIVGGIGSFRWSIIGMTLNLGQTNNTEIDTNDPAVILSEAYQPTLDRPMNLGIFHVGRGTLKVSDNGEFSGTIAKRLYSWAGESKIEGKFSFSTDGRFLKEATWQIISKPEITFYIKYFYDSTEMHFPPSGWTQWAIRKDGLSRTNHLKIQKFEVASSKLPQKFFSPERFTNNISKSDLPPVAPGPIVLTHKDGKTFWLQNGKFEAANVITRYSPENPATRNVWVVRICILGFALVGLAMVVKYGFMSVKSLKKK